MTHPRFTQIIEANGYLCALDEYGKVWSYQPIRDENHDTIGAEWRLIEDVKENVNSGT